MNEQSYTEWREAEARSQTAEMRAAVAEVNLRRAELLKCFARTDDARRAEQAAFEALTAARKRRDAALGVHA